MLNSLLEIWQLPDTIVLTPNQRLARFARSQFDAFRSTQNTQLWETLEAYPFVTWTSMLWQKLTPLSTSQRQLLTSQQIQEVWEQTILSHDFALLPLKGLALEAWELTKNWEIDIDEQNFTFNDDTTLWYRLAKSVQQRLSQNDWIDSSSSAAELPKLLEYSSAAKYLPKHLCLLNFTEFTPLQNKILNQLRRAGVKINLQHHYCKDSQVLTHTLMNPEHEMRYVVNWAIEQARDKNKRIACVVPNLAGCRKKIMQYFFDYLDDTSLVNMSLGQALLEYPLIKHAFLGLEMLATEVASSSISQFLLSPFFGDYDADAQRHALLDQQLRSKASAVLNPSHVLSITQLAYSPTQTSYGWANLFQEQLRNLGWPGSRTLSSEEYQLLAEWHSLLEKFASLDLVTNKWDLMTAIHKLEQLAAQTIFQAETTPSQRIHVLGVLEAAGLQFDASWVMGMHSEAWPQHSSPNPFLPLALQKKFGTPHANTSQEFSFCKAITQQLAQSAPTVNFSCSLVDDEKSLRPSPLLKNYPIATQPSYRIDSLTLAEQLRGTSLIETTDDSIAPVLDIKTMRSSGSQIFRDQAACPFRAFAKHRLNSVGIDLPSLGLRAAQRGQIVHAVLEKIWNKLNSHEKLSQMRQLQLQQLLQEIIHKELHIHYASFPALFIDAEKKRLQNLLLQWLSIERQRESFVVITTEQKLESVFAGLPLKLRIDRVDKIGDDKYLIIDYKTSLCSIQDWYGERPDEPQLPLYTIVSAIPVHTIALAQIRSNAMKLLTADNTPETQQQWETQLQLLAKEYLDGNAQVKPKYGEQTCRYCDLSILCRVKE